MMPLVALLAVTQASVDVTVEKGAERALIAAGIGPKRWHVRTQSFAMGPNVQFVTSIGSYDVLLDERAGRIFSIRRTYPLWKGGKAEIRSPMAFQVRAAKTIAARLGLDGSLGVGPGDWSFPNATSVRLAQLVDGHRMFVGCEPCGADLTLDGKGRLASFVWHGRPVGVVRPSRVLKAGIALTRYQASSGDRLRRFRPYRRPELIYFSPDHSPARLAWYVPADVTVDSGHGNQGGPIDAVIDAATGERVRTRIHFSDGPLIPPAHPLPGTL